MGKKASLKGKGSYVTYKAEARFAKNKKRTLTQHLKHQPNDEQASKALGKISLTPPRKTPKASKRLNASQKLFAKIDRQSVARTRDALYKAKRYQDGMSIPFWWEGVNRRAAEAEAKKGKAKETPSHSV